MKYVVWHAYDGVVVRHPSLPAAFVMLVGPFVQGQTKPQRMPDRPMAEPLTNARWHRLLEYHRAQLGVRRADVCFVGDSLTEAWEQEGAPSWQRLTKGLRAVNCGIAGDRTEQILYRLQRLELKRARPRMIVLWLGTNNLSADMPDSPEAVTRGIQAAIVTIKNASPETKIVLLSLPPNGAPDTPLQRSILETNRLLTELTTMSDATIADVHATLATPRGGWKPEYTVDDTHLSARGMTGSRR